MPFTKTVSLFDECTALAQNSTNYDALFRCIADQVDANQQAQAANVQTWLLVITAAMVFFMQAGFAMVAAGGVRIKNVQNTMLKNLLDACGSAISFWALGFAFSYGSVESDGTTFIGNRYFFLLGDVNYAYFLFQYAFCASATTIVAGTLAERCQMAAYLCYALMISAFVYPVIIHAIWSNNGFLSHFNSSKLLGTGCIDFAGGLAVHTTGGATALWAALILGPRRGRFYDSHGVALAKPKSFPGHSVALQMLGAFILWFGCKYTCIQTYVIIESQFEIADRRTTMLTINLF
jgi:Amt family ammonium transporter